jgi:hypothetical protein
MVAIAVRREVAEHTHNGQTYRATYEPDDLERSIRRLVSLGERGQMPWSAIAALRIVMIKQAYPNALKVAPKHTKRIG